MLDDTPFASPRSPFFLFGPLFFFLFLASTLSCRSPARSLFPISAERSFFQRVLVLILALAGAASAGVSLSQSWVSKGASQTGWYSSCAAGQSSGNTILVCGQYSVTALSPNGTQLWVIPAPNSGTRVWADIAIASVDSTGSNDDVVVAWAGGFVGVFSLATGAPLASFNGGSILNVANSGGSEFRSLAVRDIDNDGKAEIAVGLARSGEINAWVINGDGTIRAGWPRAASREDTYSWGVYHQNIGIFQMDGDAQLEIVVPSDVHYIGAYNLDGSPLPAGAGGWRAKSPTGLSPNWGHIAFMSDYA